MSKAIVVAALSVVACGGPTLRANVPYDERFAATRLDLWLPPSTGALRPAVLYVHGGAWHAGSKELEAGPAETLAASGFVVASIDYRLVPEARYPAAIQDAWCALAFVRAHAAELEVAPDRIAAMGYSAGGHLASLLGVAADVREQQPDCAAGRTGRVAAVVSDAGVYDLRDFPHDGSIVGFLGAELADAPARWEAASPALLLGARVAVACRVIVTPSLGLDYRVDLDPARHVGAIGRAGFAYGATVGWLF